MESDISEMAVRIYLVAFLITSTSVVMWSRAAALISVVSFSLTNRVIKTG